MLQIKTDLTRLTRWPVKLPSNWDHDTKVKMGEWVALNNDMEISRITATQVTTPNAYPLWTSTGRADVVSGGSLDVIVGPGTICVTDIFVAAGMAHDAKLTVQGSSSDPGRLALAGSGDIIVAHCMKYDTTKNEITYLMVGGSTLA